MVLHKQIQCQCQKCSILFLLAICGHKQKKEHHQQVSGIKFLWQKLPQKLQHISALGFLPSLLPGRMEGSTLISALGGLLLGRYRHTRIRFRRTGRRFLAGWIVLGWGGANTTSLEGSIGLRYITVIHDFTCLSEALILRHSENRKQILPFLRPAWRFPASPRRAHGQSHDRKRSAYRAGRPRRSCADSPR